MAAATEDVQVKQEPVEAVDLESRYGNFGKIELNLTCMFSDELNSV